MYEHVAHVYIRKGVDSSFIDWSEKSQILISFSFKTDFFQYQTSASLIFFLLFIGHCQSANLIRLRYFFAKTTESYEVCR